METNWQKKYLQKETPWDKGEPAPGLVDWLKKSTLDTKARILVPGCGCGHDANAWAQADFETTGLDLSTLALESARKRYEAQSGLAFFTSDFLTESPDQPFDLVFEHTLYCAIDPGRRDEYPNALNRWLKPGGHFLAIHFVFPITEAGPPFGADLDEIINRFSPEFELLDQWDPRNFEGRDGEEKMFLWRKKEA